jgi:VWFA-related protein
MRKTAAVLFLIAGAIRAQVTRTEAQSVLVDILVTDKKGVYVPGLTTKDFQVYEDGKEQMVDGLFTEKGSDAAAQYSLLLLFDNAAMTAREQAMARQMALQILDQAAAGDANIAVLDFGGALRISQTFTKDVTRAKQAVAQPKGSALAVGGEIPSSSDFAVRDLLRSLDGLVKNLQVAAGRKTLIFFSPGYVMNGDLASRVGPIIGAANRSNISIYPVNVRQTTMTTGGAVTDVSTPPAPSPGRAGRGGTTTLNGTAIGMNSADPTASSIPSGPALLSMLLDLASGTGGFVVRQPDDRVALAKISQEQNQFYVLSYTPPDSPDGSCHKLRVKVKRDGINLRSRESYCKRTPGDLLSGNAVARTLEQRALAAQNGNIPATMQAPYFYRSANVARVAAVVEINPGNVVFKKEKNKFVGQLDVLGIANKEDGSAGARFSDVVKFEFDSQAEVDQFKRKTYRYENQFDIAPGEYKLAVALSAGGENFGRLQVLLTIEPYAGNDFALSGIALSREFHPAGDGLSGLDEFLIDDRKKMIADGAELIASGSSKLPNAGPAGIFVEIYDPLLKTDPAVAIAFQLRILERASNAVKADSGLLRLDLRGKQGASIPVGLNIPVKDLAPGAYVVEFQALNSAGKSAKRTALFEIE